MSITNVAKSRVFSEALPLDIVIAQEPHFSRSVLQRQKIKQCVNISLEAISHYFQTSTAPLPL